MIRSDLSYEDVGVTCVAGATWEQPSTGYRRYEGGSLLGIGGTVWDAAQAQVLNWGVKTRSGFTVTPETSPDVTVREGSDYTLTASLGPLKVREPVRVVAVVRQHNRCGFAYGTRHGHPICGEEAFIVHRTPTDEVWLTVRSVSRPPHNLWALAYPAALVGQQVYHRRYLRALKQLDQNAV